MTRLTRMVVRLTDLDVVALGLEAMHLDRRRRPRNLQVRLALAVLGVAVVCSGDASWVSETGSTQTNLERKHRCCTAAPGAVGARHEQVSVERPLRVPILLIKVPEAPSAVARHDVQRLVVVRIRRDLALTTHAAATDQFIIVNL